MTDRQPVPDAPPRAITVAALLRSTQGSIGLVRRPGLGSWALVGGEVRAGESAAEACRRHVREATGWRIAAADVLAVDHESGVSGCPEAYTLVFDGQVHPEHLPRVATPNGVSPQYRWVHPDAVDDLRDLAPRQRRLVRCALGAYCGETGTRFLTGCRPD